MDKEFKGCVDKKSDDDKDSILSERCFHERYKGQSRQWLIRDGNPIDPRRTKYSLYMESYIPKKKITDADYLSERRKIMYKKFRDEAVNEQLEEVKYEPEPNDYCTEYDGNFGKPGHPSDDYYKKDEELYRKFPLYSSSALSYWNYKLAKTEETGVYFTGLTSALDKKNPFKKNSNFSTPVEIRYTDDL